MDIYDYSVFKTRNKLHNLGYYYDGYDCVFTPIAYSYVYFNQNQLLLEPKFYTQNTLNAWNTRGISVNTTPELSIAKTAINNLPQIYFVNTYESVNPYSSDDYFFNVKNFFPIQLEYAGYYYKDIAKKSNHNDRQFFREIYYKVICSDENKQYLKPTNQDGAFSTSTLQISSDYYTLVTEYGKSYTEKYIHSIAFDTTDYYSGNYSGVRGKNTNIFIENSYNPFVNQYTDSPYTDDIINQYPLKLWGTCTFNQVPYNTKWFYNLMYSASDSRKPIVAGANKYYFGGYRCDYRHAQTNLYMPGVTYRLIEFQKPTDSVTNPLWEVLDYQFTANSLNDGDIVLISGDDTALIKNTNDYLYINQNLRYNNEEPTNPKPNTCRQVFTTTNAKHAKVNGRIYTANAKKSLINPYDENAKTGGGCGNYGN